MIHQSTKPKSMLNFWREKLGIFQWMKNCFIIFILRNVTNRFLESQSIIDFTRFLENHLWDKEFQMLPPTSIYRTSIFSKVFNFRISRFWSYFSPKKNIQLHQIQLLKYREPKIICLYAHLGIYSVAGLSNSKFSNLES